MSASCPACRTALEDRLELGSLVDEARTVERVRYECAGCRAVVGRDFGLSAAGLRDGRTPVGPATLVFTGASVVRALEPLEARARSADRAGILDELRSLQRDEERQFLAAVEAVQRAVRGVAVRLARHAGLVLFGRPAPGAGAREVAALFGPGVVRPRLVAVRLTDDLPLSDAQDEEGGLVLPRAGLAQIGLQAPDVLLLLARTRLVADGVAFGDPLEGPPTPLLRVRPPPPQPTLRTWGPIEALLVDLALVSAD